MPKYFEYKICGYYLYFTSLCILEAMHVHVSEGKLQEGGSAKFYVKSNGDSIVKEKGILTEREVLKIQKFIKENYITMFENWCRYSEQGFYGDK